MVVLLTIRVEISVRVVLVVAQRTDTYARSRRFGEWVFLGIAISREIEVGGGGHAVERVGLGDGRVRGVAVVGSEFLEVGVRGRGGEVVLSCE